MRHAFSPCLLLVALGCGQPSPTGPVDVAPPAAQTHPQQKSRQVQSPAPGEATPATVKADPGPAVQADFLWSDYAENPIAGDRNYKGRRVRVTLYVDRIGQDERGMFVRLRAYDSSNYDTDAVACYCRPDQADTLQVLRPGRVVTAVGTCRGKVEDARFWKSTSVVLEDCELTVK